jgi:hypothetical protein
MTDTIENICYEYAENSLFSKELSLLGAPKKIIVYLQYIYIAELSKFLSNYGYEISSQRNMGKHFGLIRFELKNLSSLDYFFDNNKSGEA